MRVAKNRFKKGSEILPRRCLKWRNRLQMNDMRGDNG